MLIAAADTAAMAKIVLIIKASKDRGNSISNLVSPKVVALFPREQRIFAAAKDAPDSRSPIPSITEQ
jgi:hypothetical protein